MKRSAFLIGLLPLFLILSACEKTDTDLVLDFVNSWLEARGALYKDDQGNYKPTLKGAGVAMGFATTDDPQADAAVQAGKMAKDIADNDKLMREGEAAFNANPPDPATAKKKMDAAVDNRPDDWYYRNHRAFMNLRTGNEKAAQKDLNDGVQVCNENQDCLEALHRDRAAFYTNMQLGVFMTADQSLISCATHAMAVDSYQALVNSEPNNQSYRDGLQIAKGKKCS